MRPQSLRMIEMVCRQTRLLKIDQSSRMKDREYRNRGSAISAGNVTMISVADGPAAAATAAAATWRDDVASSVAARNYTRDLRGYS